MISTTTPTAVQLDRTPISLSWRRLGTSSLYELLSLPRSERKCLAPSNYAYPASVFGGMHKDKGDCVMFDSPTVYTNGATPVPSGPVEQSTRTELHRYPLDLQNSLHQRSYTVILWTCRTVYTNGATPSSSGPAEQSTQTELHRYPLDLQNSLHERSYTVILWTCRKNSYNSIFWTCRKVYTNGATSAASGPVEQLHQHLLDLQNSLHEPSYTSSIWTCRSATPASSGPVEQSTPASSGPVGQSTRGKQHRYPLDLQNSLHEGNYTETFSGVIETEISVWCVLIADKTSAQKERRYFPALRLCKTKGEHYPRRLPTGDALNYIPWSVQNVSACRNSSLLIT
ncbi:hypothetical protein Bbelb_066590 [Branchiostoma belcheri]|nr:hypothetical protein Bbelb_066590 [Branchiostoma belcheri]